MQPNFSLPFYIVTDASTIGVAGYLGQDTLEEASIIQFSRCLRQNERCYTISDIEYIGIIPALKKFSEYIKGNHFIIYTDHECLKWLSSSGKWNSRLTRGTLCLEDHNYTVIPIKGKRNWFSDTFSRAPPDLESEKQYSLKCSN